MFKPTPSISSADEARFWAKVDKSPGQGPNGDCWCWTGKIGYDDYPASFSVRSRNYRPSHIALAISGKPRPSDKHGGLHSCDHRACVRPDHLRWGTEFDNRLDMIERRKYRPCMQPDQVREIRASTERHVDIARRLGVTSACILNIRKRVTHAHID